MTKLLRTVEDILSSEVTSLAELARLAGFLPQEMYAGADFEQLDLSGQDVSFLLGVQSRMITSLLGDPRFSWQDRF